MATIGMSFYTWQPTAWHPLTAAILIETSRDEGMTQSLLFLNSSGPDKQLWTRQRF